MSNLKIEKSSFRDRSGFIYKKKNKLYRQINKCYKEHYDHLVQSGLYKKLVEHYLLIPHKEISNLHFSEEAFLVIQPDMVPYISYPFESFIDLINPSNAIDIGANTGLFSRLVSKKGIPTISTDSDSLAIEKNYKRTLSESDNNCLPLIIDFINPSPAIVWENKERLSFSERFHSDLIMALAILHHLSISNNLPLSYISNYLSGLCKFLIIEFIPKIDPQVKKLLANREDIFDKYSLLDFKEEFSRNFKIIAHIKVLDTERVIYLMTKL